jgi:hypothetical protein
VVKININDGNTFKLDLSNEDQAKELIQLLGDYDFQQKITAITAFKQYTRRHRCPNKGCKQLVKLVCPDCGVVNDGGNFVYTGNQYTLIRPNANRVSFSVENTPFDAKGGTEKLICNAGEMQLSITTYAQQPAARVMLLKIGEQRYNPNIR